MYLIGLVIKIRQDWVNLATCQWACLGCVTVLSGTLLLIDRRLALITPRLVRSLLQDHQLLGIIKAD